MLVPGLMSSIVGLSDADALQFARGHSLIVVDARDIHRGNHGGKNTDAKRDGEALDRPSAELKKNHTRKKRRDVGVQYRRQGIFVSRFDSRAHRTSRSQLL